MVHLCYGQKIVTPPAVVSLGGLLRLRPFPLLCRSWLEPCMLRLSAKPCRPEGITLDQEVSGREQAGLVPRRRRSRSP